MEKYYKKGTKIKITNPSEFDKEKDYCRVGEIGIIVAVDERSPIQTYKVLFENGRLNVYGGIWIHKDTEFEVIWEVGEEILAEDLEDLEEQNNELEKFKEMWSDFTIDEEVNELIDDDEIVMEIPVIYGEPIFKSKEEVMKENLANEIDIIITSLQNIRDILNGDGE